MKMAALSSTSATETSISVDGMLTDSATIASVLDETQQQHKISELTLRNVNIDDVVAESARRLLLQHIGENNQEDHVSDNETNAMSSEQDKDSGGVDEDSKPAAWKRTKRNTNCSDQTDEDENDTNDTESNPAQDFSSVDESRPRGAYARAASATTSDEDVDIIHSANLRRPHDSSSTTGVIFHRPFTSQYFQRFKAFHGRNPASFKFFGGATQETAVQQRSRRRIWSKIELIHCSGRVSSVLSTIASIAAEAGAYTGKGGNDDYQDPSETLPPAVQQISFTGSVPIAHNPRYSLDNDSMEAIGRALVVDPTPEAVSASLVLSTLSIKGTRLDPIGWQLMCNGIGASKTLRTLRMSHCALQAGNVDRLATALGQNRHLQVLLLAHCKVMTPTSILSPNQNRVEAANQPDAGGDENQDADFHVPLAGEDISELNDQNVRRNRPLGPGDGRMELIDVPTENDDHPDPAAHIDRYTLDPLLESLVQHPTLECLNIDGMRIESPRAIQALADLVSSPTSKLWHLGLKNNGRIPDDKPNFLPVISALRDNKVMTSLLLSGNNVDDTDLEAIVMILANHNRTLRGLSLAANRIGDSGINALATHLPQIRGLNYLDLQRNTNINTAAKERLIAALGHNCEIERLDLDGTYHQMKAHYLNLNRGGRRLLLAHNAAPVSIWPHVLGRVNRLNFGRLTPTAILDVLYCLVRGPALFQQRRRPLSNDDEQGETMMRKRSRN